MNDSPDVSVVMGVYNGASHLRETIDSVLTQEDVSLEYVIVNDGSTDESPKILNEYATIDSRVRVILQENQGLTKALMRGCAESRGRYIARQDVGDVSLPRRLTLQTQALDANDKLAFVSCWTEFCGPEWEHLYFIKGTGIARVPILVLGGSDNPTLADGPYHHGSVMFRKESYCKAGGYRSEFYFAQDWDLWYRLAESGQFQVIEQTLYRVRISPGSISTENKKAQDTLGELALCALAQRKRGFADQDILVVANDIRPGNNKTTPRLNRGRSLYFIGECLRKNGDRRSLGYFRRAIQEEPLFLKSWIRILQCLLEARR